jgi:hypothetical protein
MDLDISDGFFVGQVGGAHLGEGAVRRDVAGLDQHAPIAEATEGNGRHRYNNQDHSIWNAALATRNLVARSMTSGR